ncbi:MAG: DinB family protein [Dehalococcoidia bacterium]|nr:DinB family protein [Dehalococcoidia bacterium]
MHPTYEAANFVLRDSFAMLAAALEGLPDAALDWTPTSGMSSLAVLATHSITSTLFWAGAAAGASPERDRYLGKDRPASFQARGTNTDLLRERISSVLPDIERILRQGTEVSLEEEMPWVEDDGRHRTGAECLVHAAAHLREHVGQAQLMRDLWLAASREGH